MFRNALEPWHLLILVVVLVLVFGSKKLPDAARALGKSMRILKSEAKAMKGEGGTPPTASPAPGPAAPEAPRTIQAAPGDTASARPVAESSHDAH
ncbi:MULTISPECIES: Sec-independent protein translocase subunit TatA [unclassified Streptomyces]|uniref:Sec-independent protein translocase subunit TatA n=1 Tax=unclassified Streptomyces TaxID=2593676 RepID=UPI0038192C17